MCSVQELRIVAYLTIIINEILYIGISGFPCSVNIVGTLLSDSNPGQVTQTCAQCHRSYNHIA